MDASGSTPSGVPVRLDARRWLVVLRSRLRQGGRRVRTSLVPVVSGATGAGVAWAIAAYALKQPAPIFASIACWLCLGFTRNRDPRAVAEVGVGSAIGVAIGELFARLLGAGPWQIALVLIVATLLARLLDRGMTFTMQSATNSIVIVGLSGVPMVGGGFGRWLDAIIGAVVAFVIAVVLPRTVAERPRRFARSALDEIAETLEMLASALRAHDIEAMLDANGQLRAVREAVDDWEKALKAAADVASLNFALRTELPQINELSRLLRLARRAETTVTMLVRQAIGFSEQSGVLPGVAEPLETAASAARSLAASVGGWHKPERARVVLQQLAGLTAPTAIRSDDWRPAALMALVRAVVIDLLQMTGLSRADAGAKLAATMGAPFALGSDALPPEDETSPLWG